MSQRFAVADAGGFRIVPNGFKFVTSLVLPLFQAGKGVFVENCADRGRAGLKNVRQVLKMLQSATPQSQNLIYPDDHFSFCPTGFDVSHRFVSLFIWKNLVQNRFYRPRIDERGNFAQLFAV